MTRQCACCAPRRPVGAHAPLHRKLSLTGLQIAAAAGTSLLLGAATLLPLADGRGAVLALAGILAVWGAWLAVDAPLAAYRGEYHRPGRAAPPADRSAADQSAADQSTCSSPDITVAADAATVAAPSR